MPELLLPVRPLLAQAIQVLELCYGYSPDPWCADWESTHPGAASRSNLLKIERHPLRSTQEALVRLIWSHAVINEQPTIWLCRSHTPDISLAFLLCCSVDLSLSDLFKGMASESQFGLMTQHAARLAAAPLQLGSPDSRDAFETALDLAQSSREPMSLYFDWVPSVTEIKATQASQLRSVFPSELVSRP